MAASLEERFALVSRPQRWDTPFGEDMTDESVARLLERPEFASIQAERFPRQIPLPGILRNDSRILTVQPGELVVREGDYGSSAFLILEGALRVAPSPGLPAELLGRKVTRRKSIFSALAQLWRNSLVPESRDVEQYHQQNRSAVPNPAGTGVLLQDVPGVLNRHATNRLEAPALFGELAALGRIPRSATVFAETEAVLVEIRWQGLRELHRFDPGWKRRIDDNYRANGLKAQLQVTPIFRNLSEKVLDEIAKWCLFETYGSFDWHAPYKQVVAGGGSVDLHEPVIAHQGDHPDGLLLIRAGFSRIRMKVGGGERTLSYLGAGDSFGFYELFQAWKTGQSTQLETSMSAVGYVDVVRVPTHILEEVVFGEIRTPVDPYRLSNLAKVQSVAQDAVLDWVVDERLNNGRKAMVIDLNRCTRCDDCVRGCASTHGGNPRFRREGKTFDHWMIAQACMHCVDPVCMIGCPTGAIHRSPEGKGIVVINDLTCIGCGTCSASCPYDNIRMVTIHDHDGKPVLSPDDRRPISKATKCDFCHDQLGGPACVRACPHDALQRVDLHEAGLFEAD